MAADTVCRAGLEGHREKTVSTPKGKQEAACKRGSARSGQSERHETLSRAPLQGSCEDSCRGIRARTNEDHQWSCRWEMKEGIGGCGGTYPTVGKCVDQNSGVPETLPRAIKPHVDSSVITARGLVEGALRGSHPQTKGGLVEGALRGSHPQTKGAQIPFPSLNTSRKPNGKIPSESRLGFLCMNKTCPAKTEKGPQAFPQGWGKLLQADHQRLSALFRAFEGAAFPD